MASYSVAPVFFKSTSIPDASIKRPTVLEVCLAAEKVTGQGSVIGAQIIGGLWRVYPATAEARTNLLTAGLKVRGTLIQVAANNPFLLRDESGEEKPATKVWIDNIPISVADSDIEEALRKTNCELRSPIKLERARNADGKLTRFLTGRRFVFVTVPSKPLEKSLRINIFNAKIFHKEQKQTEAFCSRCLSKGHHSSACTGEVVCKQCRKPGHKRGDPECDIEKESTAHKEEEKKKEERGRTVVRQTTLRSSLNIHNNRARSETPKRPRSGEETSPIVDNTKQARRDNSTLDPSPHSEYDSQAWG